MPCWGISLIPCHPNTIACSVAKSVAILQEAQIHFPQWISAKCISQILHAGWVQSLLLDWTTELLDWTTGLTQTAKYNSFSTEQEAKLSYFLTYFANTAPYSVFP